MKNLNKILKSAVERAENNLDKSQDDWLFFYTVKTCVRREFIKNNLTIKSADYHYFNFINDGIDNSWRYINILIIPS
jgi:hypothetical protein